MGSVGTFEAAANTLMDGLGGTLEGMRRVQGLKLPTQKWRPLSSPFQEAPESWTLPSQIRLALIRQRFTSSGVTSKPAIRGHFKSGHGRIPGP